MNGEANRRRAKRVSFRSALVGAVVTALGAMMVVQAPAASATEVSVGRHVLKVPYRNTTVTSNADFVACKISQGSGYYKVRVRVKISNTGVLVGTHRLNIGSNLGATTTAWKSITGISSTVSVVSNGKAKSTIRFTTFIGKGSSAGYSVYPGTTLRSFTVGSLPTC